MTSGLRILVVEDCADTRTSLRLLLRKWGHEVAEAADGTAPLCSAASFCPDVVLLDIGLPGLNGYEVAEQLRSLPNLAESLLVLKQAKIPGPADQARAFQQVSVSTEFH